MIVNILDPKLPLLASNAAVELDLLIKGYTTDLEAVKQLGSRLRQSLDKPAPDQPARGLLLDTETVAILGQAFTRAGVDDPKTILGRLMQRTDEISEELSSAKEDSKHEALERLLGFCLALSQSAAAYRQSVLDVRPSHPYRR